MAIVVSIIKIPHPANTDCSFFAANSKPSMKPKWSRKAIGIYNIVLENFQG